MEVKFFMLPYNNPENANYAHGAVALAEGFRSLGINFYGNIDYWHIAEENNFLITSAERNSAGVHIYTTGYYRMHGVENEKSFNVLLDNDDGLFTLSNNPTVTAKFKLVLRSHYNGNFSYPGNVVPWAFGLSSRIIDANTRHNSEILRKQIYYNFRVSHSVRDLALQELVPMLSSAYLPYFKITEVDKSNETEYHYYCQSGRRHNEEFFSEINISLLTLAFGGYLDILPFGNDFSKKTQRILNRLFSKIISGYDCYFIYQYDSWRLWETLNSNTCPLTFDFNSWNHILPETPENYKHYIGIKRLNFQEAADAILSLNENEIKAIGNAGKEWSNKYYSPKVVASRLMEHIQTV